MGRRLKQQNVQHLERAAPEQTVVDNGFGVGVGVGLSLYIYIWACNAM